MRCPRCVQWTGPSSGHCPHCGFELASLDGVLGSEFVFLDRMTDATRCLRLGERAMIERELDRFEARFPQLFAAVYIGHLPATTNVRQFAFWLLNRAAVSSVDYTKPNQHGVLLVVDQNSQTAALTVGYFIEPFVEDRDLLEVLRSGHPMFVSGDSPRGIRRCLRKLGGVLRTRCRQAARHPERFLSRFSPGSDPSGGGGTGTGAGTGLEPIRSGHHAPPEPPPEAGGAVTGSRSQTPQRRGAARDGRAAGGILEGGESAP